MNSRRSTFVLTPRGELVRDALRLAGALVVLALAAVGALLYVVGILAVVAS